MAQSLCKKVHPDYHAIEEEVTVQPLYNSKPLYAGGRKTTKVSYTISKRGLSGLLTPDATYTVETDAITEPRIDCDKNRFLSMYTTRPP